MNYKELKSKALNVKTAYDQLNIKKGERKWNYLEYAQGLVGDIGDLMKMLMAKSNLRSYNGDLDEDIKHELSDCLWSIIVISEELKIDLGEIFPTKMTELYKKIEAKLNNS